MPFPYEETKPGITWKLSIKIMIVRCFYIYYKLVSYLAFSFMQPSVTFGYEIGTRHLIFEVADSIESYQCIANTFNHSQLAF